MTTLMEICGADEAMVREKTIEMALEYIKRDVAEGGPLVLERVLGGVAGIVGPHSGIKSYLDGASPSGFDDQVEA